MSRVHESCYQKKTASGPSMIFIMVSIKIMSFHVWMRHVTFRWVVSLRAWVMSLSRLLEIIGLFCKKALLKRRSPLYVSCHVSMSRVTESMSYNEQKKDRIGTIHYFHHGIHQNNVELFALFDHCFYHLYTKIEAVVKDRSSGQR